MTPNSHSHEDSFTSLYFSSYARLVRFSTLYLGSKDEAEDVVQELFLHLWEQREFLQEISHPDSYLFSAVKRRCLNVLRSNLSQLNHRRESLSSLSDNEIEFNLYCLQLVDQTELSIEEIEDTVRHALEILPERCREIFVMSKIKGMKYKEIALELNLSESTVENQISIALKKLRSEFSRSIPMLILLSNSFV